MPIKPKPIDVDSSTQAVPHPMATLKRAAARGADPVNHPAHYRNNPKGIECIDVVEHLPFNRGNAIKYLWRAGEKGDAIEDLKKAAWYVNREIERLTRS